MTTPGRAVRIVMRQRLAARSIKIFGTEAVSSFFLRISRILRSSASSGPNSFLGEYHFERQSLLTATRRPIGLVFCPILLLVRQSDLDVATALDDWTSRTARLGSEPLHGSCRARHRFLHQQRLGLDLVVVFRIRNRRLQRLGDESG